MNDADIITGKELIYSNIENLVLWARSEQPGYAIDQTSSRFSTGGGSVNTEP